VVLASHKHPGAADVEVLYDALQQHEALLAMQSHMQSEAERLRCAFGERFCGMDTAWTNILAALTWTQRMRELCGQRPMSERLVQWATRPGEHTPPVQALVAHHAHFEEQWSVVEAGFEAPEPTFRGTPLKALSLTALRARLDTIRERIDELQSWIDFKSCEGQCERAGLQGFLHQLQKALPPSDQLERIFQKSVYQAWATAIIDQDPQLKEFRGRHHEQVIDEFKAVDRKLVQLASQCVVAACSARRPRSVAAQAQESEIGLLRREAAKRRRHWPVRRLFESMPNLLLKLKPCLCMSPLSVSQFLPPEKFKFDLVIFDEASQIFTEDAIGAIYRGHQLVIAGDSKQLPPTDFFKSIDSESDEVDEHLLEDETSADFNSVLDECESLPGMSVYALKWHYRSRHESLIAFSNHRFYHSRLITFPSAYHHHKALGIEFVHLPDGVYDRGGKRINQREAEEVADRVFRHFAQYPQKSIGVVAFSQAQMVAIEDEIERRRKTNTAFEHFFTEDRLEGFFVKNLENVQGDERDVIIFSIGYGRDQHGRLTMTFGPLNRNGGERRLNVAVTRAREKVVLVSSITAADIDVGATQAAGVLHLYHYLDYAARGEEALLLTGPQGQREADSPFEEDVAGEIRALGYTVVPQVGCSGFRIDLGIVDPAEPGRFLLGVECDGATYHSAATARDRDRLRQQILEQLGWRLHRIWSPDWVTKRAGEIRRLREAIEAARHRDSYETALAAVISDAEDADSQQPMPDVERVAVTHTNADAVLPGTIPYELYEVDMAYEDRGEFHEPHYRAEQSALLAEVVSTEGPLHIELATERVLAAWGRKRAGDRIRRAMAEAVRICAERSWLEQREDFLWPVGVNEVPVRVPVSDRTKRKVGHIPPEEIQACMLLIIRHEVGIGLDALLRVTANVFGFDRTGNDIRQRLLKECEVLQQRGAVTNVDGWLSC
jgi:very-short-patch-repair endonuclease